LSNPLLMTFGAARNAGFYREGEYCPDPRSFMPWQESQHEIVRNLQLIEFLGLSAQGEELEFPLMPADWRWLQRCPRDFPAPGSYVCLHAGARLPSRRWPARCFAELADALHQAGLHIVLTGSPQEAELTRAVAAAMRAPAFDLTGMTDLGGFAALASQARLVICNDTGIVHIAAAVKTPSVAICRGGDPRRWAPLNTRRHRIVHAAEDVRGVLAGIRQVLADNPDSHRFRSGARR
jgi:ADP-heptose:LPS heptosyltransferase